MTTVATLLQLAPENESDTLIISKKGFAELQRHAPSFGRYRQQAGLT